MDHWTKETCHRIDHVTLRGYREAQKKNHQTILDLEQRVYELEHQRPEPLGWPGERF